MKKTLSKIILVLALFFTFLCNNANALVNTTSDINAKINQLQTIYNQDLFAFINKTELVGYRLSNFNMHASQYKNIITNSIERLNNIINQINTLNSSSELSDTEKQNQIKNLYHDADAIIYDIDNQTVNYTYLVRDTMPSVSYQRFIKRFISFYNSVNLTGNEISVH